MRTTPFRDVFDSVIRLYGRDPRQNVSSDVATTTVAHMNDRVRTIWQCWRWPEWEITEERAFRPIWSPTEQYFRVGSNGAPDEVFYMGDGYVVGGDFGANSGYYRVLSTAVSDPPVSTPPKDTNYFEPITNIDTFIAYDQLGRLAIGMVLGVYSSNSRSPTCSNARKVHYKPSEKGIDVCCVGVPTVFVTHKMPCPVYTMIPYVAGKTYSRADTVFDPDTGECYQAVTSTTAVPTDTNFWNWIPFLEVWSDYVGKGSFADSLMEFDQGGNADIQAKMVMQQFWDTAASDAMQSEIDALAVQGQKLQWNFCKKDSCYSQPWNGGMVVLLGT